MDQLEEPAVMIGSPDTAPEPPGSEDPAAAAATTTDAPHPTKRRSSSVGTRRGTMDRGVSTLPSAYGGDDDDAEEEGHDAPAAQRVLAPVERPRPTKRRRLDYSPRTTLACTAPGGAGQCASAGDPPDLEDYSAPGTAWLPSPSPSPSPSLSPSSFPPPPPALRRRRIGDDALDGVDEHIADHAILRVRAQRRVVARAAYVVVFRTERVLLRPPPPLTPPRDSRGWDAHGKLRILWQGDDTGPAGVAVSEGCQVSVTCGRVRLVK